jgi:hypothetical protein
MSEQSDDLMFGEDAGHPQPADPVESLTWSLLDKQASDDEMRLLDTLLLSDANARRTYVNCTQLHMDLISLFQDQARAPVGSPALILPSHNYLDGGTTTSGA